MLPIAPTPAGRRISVAVVHGTWGQNAAFLQATSAFQVQLRERFGNRIQVRPFTWSGRNSQRMRLQAANEFAVWFADVIKGDPDAAHAGNAGVLRRLHAAGYPANARFRLSSNGGSPTPLNLAIRNGDLEVARTLLDLGARGDTPGPEQWSPLESAVQNNRLDFARLFLERGADVNAVDAAGYAPLLLAVSIDFGDTAMVELLLQAGAKVEARRLMEERPSTSHATTAMRDSCACSRCDDNG